MLRVRKRQIDCIRNDLSMFFYNGSYLSEETKCTVKSLGINHKMNGVHFSPPDVIRPGVVLLSPG